MNRGNEEVRLPSVYNFSKKPRTESFVGNSLSNSMNKTNPKVKEIVRAYGKSMSRSRSTRHAMKSLQKTEDKSIHSITSQEQPKFNTLASTRSPKASTQNKIKSLLYDIQKAKSDKLELVRDLATYEFNFSSHSKLSEKCQFITQASNEFSELSVVETSIHQQKLFMEKLKSGVSRLVNIEKNFSNKWVSAEVEIEHFYLKKSSAGNNLEEVYKGSVKVSGEVCLVRVKGDKWLEHIELDVKTLEGIHFKEFLNLKISTYETQTELSQLVKSKILSRLFLTLDQKRWKLSYDPNHGKTFLVLVCELRGCGHCSLELTQKEDNVTIKIVGEYEYLELPKDFLTEKDSVFAESTTKLKRVIQKYMCFLQKSYSFVWLETDDPSAVFSEKECDSILLNEDYLKELFGIVTFVLAYTFEVKVDEVLFKVEVYDAKNQFKIAISWGSETQEVVRGSKYYKLIFGLQSLDIRHAKTTLENSLELKTSIRKLFPRVSKRHFSVA